MNINVAKREIIRDLFIDTADDNYIVARWSFANNLNLDFFWLSVQALEKYMKATLLLNGESAKDYGHDVCELYDRIKSFTSELLPTELLMPAQLGTKNWRNEKPEEFLSRLYQNGNAENRYRIYGFFQKPGDLHKVDMMLYFFRRICVTLDFAILKDSKVTQRINRMKRPELWKINPQYKLEQVFDGKRGEYLQHIFLNGNFAFAPDYQHQPSRIGIAGHSSALWLHILHPLEESPDEIGIEAAKALNDWVLENIQLSKNVKRQLKQAIQAHT